MASSSNPFFKFIGLENIASPKKTSTVASGPSAASPPTPSTPVKAMPTAISFGSGHRPSALSGSTTPNMFEIKEVYDGRGVNELTYEIRKSKTTAAQYYLEKCILNADIENFTMIVSHLEILSPGDPSGTKEELEAARARGFSIAKNILQRSGSQATVYPYATQLVRARFQAANPTEVQSIVDNTQKDSSKKENTKISQELQAKTMRDLLQKYVEDGDFAGFDRIIKHLELFNTERNPQKGRNYIARICAKSGNTSFLLHLLNTTTPSEFSLDVELDTETEEVPLSPLMYLATHVAKGNNLFVLKNKEKAAEGETAPPEPIAPYEAFLLLAIKYKADVKCADSNGTTALGHLLAEMEKHKNIPGHNDVSAESLKKFLIAKGVDPYLVRDETAEAKAAESPKSQKGNLPGLQLIEIKKPAHQQKTISSTSRKGSNDITETKDSKDHAQPNSNKEEPTLATPQFLHGNTQEIATHLNSSTEIKAISIKVEEKKQLERWQTSWAAAPAGTEITLVIKEGTTIQSISGASIPSPRYLKATKQADGTIKVSDADAKEAATRNAVYATFSDSRVTSWQQKLPLFTSWMDGKVTHVKEKPRTTRVWDIAHLENDIEKIEFNSGKEVELRKKLTINPMLKNRYAALSKVTSSSPSAALPATTVASSKTGHTVTTVGEMNALSSSSNSRSRISSADAPATAAPSSTTNNTAAEMATTSSSSSSSATAAPSSTTTASPETIRTQMLKTLHEYYHPWASIISNDTAARFFTMSWRHNCIGVAKEAEQTLNSPQAQSWTIEQLAEFWQLLKIKARAFNNGKYNEKGKFEIRHSAIDDLLISYLVNEPAATVTFS